MNFVKTKTLQEVRDAVYDVRRQMDKIFDAAERDERALTQEEQKQIDTLRTKHQHAEEELHWKMRDLEGESKTLQAIRGDIEHARRRDAANDTTMGKIARSLKTGEAMPREIEDRAMNSTNGNLIINDPVFTGREAYELQAQNILAASGVEMVVMENNTSYPKATNFSDGQWVPEGTQVTATDFTITSIDWEFKSLACHVVVQDQLLFDSGGRAERMITQVIRRQAADTLLKSILYGDNSADNGPDGLDNISGVQTEDAGGSSFSNYTYLLNAYRKVLDANVEDPSSINMIANPVLWRQLAGLVDSNGQFLDEPPGIDSMPKHYTTAVKTNYGASTDQTVAYVGSFRDNVIIGFQPTMNFRLNELYKDYLRTGFLLHLRVDVQILHPDLVCIIQNIDTALPAGGV